MIKNFFFWQGQICTISTTVHRQNAEFSGTAAEGWGAGQAGEAQGFRHMRMKALLPEEAKHASPPPTLSQQHWAATVRPQTPRAAGRQCSRPGAGPDSAPCCGWPHPPSPCVTLAGTALPIKHMIFCFFVTLTKGFYSYYRNEVYLEQKSNFL